MSVFSYICPVIDNELQHNIIKVVRQNSWSITGDAWKTNVKLLNFKWSINYLHSLSFWVLKVSFWQRSITVLMSYKTILISCPSHLNNLLTVIYTCIIYAGSTLSLVQTSRYTKLYHKPRARGTHPWSAPSRSLLYWSSIALQPNPESHQFQRFLWTVFLNSE